MNRIKIPLIEELRAVRRRLAEEQQLDVERYAAMLRERARPSSAHYVTKPLLPEVDFSSTPKPGDAG